MLAGLTADLNCSVVVLKQAELDAYEAQQYDALIIQGTPQGKDLTLKATIIHPKELVVEEAMKPVELPKDERSDPRLLPANHFLRNQFIFCPIPGEVPLQASIYGDKLASVAKLFLRHVLAVLFYYKGGAARGRLFEKSLSEGKLLPDLHSEPLGEIFRTTGFYFATRTERINRAIEALDLAHLFAPEDTETEVMRAYLLLATGQKASAGQILEKIDINADNAVKVHQLKGEYLRIDGRPAEAIEAFKTALQFKTHFKERPEQEHLIHLVIALEYGVSDHVDRQTRSSEMIKHLEEAIVREPRNPVYQMLQGYAWALGGSSTLFEDAFKRAESLPGWEENRPFYEYWHARSLFELGRTDDSLASLSGRLGDPENIEDPRILELYAKNLIRIKGKEAEAEKYLDRIIATGYPSGEVWRYKGLAVIARMRDLEHPPNDDPELRTRLSEDARTYLLKSVHSDDELSTTHTLLAHLYLRSGDTVNAKKHCERALELDPNDRDPLLLLVDIAMDSNDLLQAFEALAKARLILGDDAELEFKEGLARQRAGDFKAAKDAYLKSLDFEPDALGPHTQVGVVLLELGERDEALLHMDAALRLDPEDAQAMAGKAVALSATAEDVATVDLYRLAAEKFELLLDPVALKEKLSWPEHVCKAAEPLIARVKISRDEKAAHEG